MAKFTGIILQSLVFVGATGMCHASTLSWYANLFGGGAVSSSPLGAPAPADYLVAPVSTTSTLIPKFDPTLGTLNSVLVTLTGYELATLNVFNHDGTSSHSFVNGTASVPLTLNGPGGLTFSVVMNATQPSGTVGAATPAFSVPNWTPGQTISFCSTIGGTYNAGTNTCTSNSFVDTENTYSGLTATQAANGFSSPVTNFIGPGGFITISVFSGAGTYNASEVGGGGNLSFNGSSSVAASLQVDYNYTPASVPEPFSAGLAGAGLLCLALIARRKHNQA